MCSAAKMRAGLPLSDADRAPWLRRLAGIIDDELSAGHCLVLACSALKEAYREILRAGRGARVHFVRKLSLSSKYLPVCHGEGESMTHRVMRRCCCCHPEVS